MTHWLHHLATVRAVMLTAALLLSFGAAAQYADLQVELSEQTWAADETTRRIGVVVTNLGPDAATGVVLTTSTNAAVPRYQGCGRSTGEECTIPLLQPNTSTTVTLILDAPPADREYDVTVNVSSAVPDPELSNNRAGIALAGFLPPQLRLALNNPGSVNPGDVAEYEATVINDSLYDALQLSFGFDLPEGWTFEGAESNALTCTTVARRVECSANTLAGKTSATATLMLRAYSGRDGMAALAPATVTTARGVSSQTHSTLVYFSTYRLISVTSTEDSGKGSFRSAIARVNEADDARLPQKIVFEFAERGPNTIRPLSPLPAVERVSVIDGEWKALTVGDDRSRVPEVEISGALLQVGDGLDLRADVEVRGLIINNFPDNGIVISHRAVVERCYIGTDRTGQYAVPNGLRGIVVRQGEVPYPSYERRVDLRENVISGNGRSGIYMVSGGGMRIVANRIGASAGAELRPLPNGASGIYFGPVPTYALVLGNVIAWNAHAGIAVDPAAASVEARSNRFIGNGSLAIDWALDGVTPNRPGPGIPIPKMPEITAVTFDDASQTSTVIGRSEAPFPSAEIEVYISDTADPTGYGEGALPVGYAEPAADGTFSLSVNRDLRGRFVSATSIVLRPHWDTVYYSTSEFSRAFLASGPAIGPIGDAEILASGADLSVSVHGGDSLTATLRNLGPETAENVVLSLTLASGASFSNLQSGCSGSGTSTIHCTYRRLIAGDIISVRPSVSVPPERTAVVVNASVTSSTPDPDASNNTAIHELRYAARVQVDVASPEYAAPGEAVAFGLHVRNVAAVTAHDVEVTIPIPEGWTFVSSSAGGWTCVISGGAIVCRTTAIPSGAAETFSIVVRAPATTEGTAQTLRTTTRVREVPSYATSEGSLVYRSLHIVNVTTIADSGPGSLRDAIERAAVSRYPVRLEFDLPETEASGGVFTIAPLTPLPPIGQHGPGGSRYPIVIDGATQTGRTGDTNPDGPEIRISGRSQSSGNGLTLHAPASLRNVTIDSFPGDGVVLLGGRTYLDAITVAGCFIGTNAAGDAAAPNGRRGVSVETGAAAVQIIGNVISGNVRSGVFVTSFSKVQVTANRIGVSAHSMGALPNGASGVYVQGWGQNTVRGNTIWNNMDAGVAVHTESRVVSRANSMGNNGWLGIDHGLDGVTYNDAPDRPHESVLPKFPVILTATWDAGAGVTRVDGRVAAWPTGVVVEIFRNDTPDPAGFGECQEIVAVAVLSGQPLGTEQTFTASIPRDLRGSVLTATATHAHATSELSAAVQVQ